MKFGGLVTSFPADLIFHVTVVPFAGCQLSFHLWSKWLPKQLQWAVTRRQCLTDAWSSCYFCPLLSVIIMFRAGRLTRPSTAPPRRMMRTRSLSSWRLEAEGFCDCSFPAELSAFAAACNKRPSLLQAV